MSSTTSASEKSSSWYPGKLLGRKDVKNASETQGSATETSRPSVSNSNNPNNSNLEKGGSSSNASSSGTIGSASKVETVTGKRNSKSIGTILIESHGMKFLASERPTFQIHVENEFFSTSMATFVHSFSFSDVSTEILLTIVEEFSLRKSVVVVGQIVLPVSYYLSLGKALPPKREWRMFLPLYKNKDIRVSRFRASMEPGTGLPKTREKIGFIDITVSVTLNNSPAGKPVAPFTLFFRKPTNVNLAKIDKSPLEVKVSEDVNRLRQCLSPPLILAPFLNPPEIVVLIVLGVLLSLSAHWWQIPIFIFSLVLLNGILVKMSRNFSKLVIYNDYVPAPPPGSVVSQEEDPRKYSQENKDFKEKDLRENSKDNYATNNSSSFSTSFSSPPSDEFLAVLGLTTSFSTSSLALSYASVLSSLVTMLEKISNSLSFADSLMTQISFLAFVVAAILASLLMYFLGSRFFLGLVLSVVLSLISMKDNIAYFLSLNFDAIDDSTPAAIVISTDDLFNLEEEDRAAEVNRRIKDVERRREVVKAMPKPLVALWHFLKGLEYFYYRLPDNPEVIHRHIAGLSFVREDGAEFEQAEEYFKKET